jgi:putative endonuclease
MFYVYILKCSDNSPYTGFSENLKERFKRHQNGDVPATKPRLPVELILKFGFTTKPSFASSDNLALFMEKYSMVERNTRITEG